MSATTLERLYDIHLETGCWIWRGVRTNNGYSQIAVDGTKYYAHRISYQLHRGPIGKGRDIDHLCRNRACINPDHLEVVTRAVNAQRGAKAKLTPEAVVAIRSAPPSVTTRSLAKHWGVGEFAAGNARKGITWSNVA